MTFALRTLLLFFCFVGLVPAQVPQRPANEPLPADRIVAVVNDEVITLHELHTRLDIALDQLKKQGTPLPPRDVLEKQMLERLVMDKVQMQRARDTGLRVDDSQLEQALQRIATGNKMSLTQFRDALQKDGIAFAKFREDIREEMTIARLRDRELENKIVISEGEIDNYLDTEKAKGDSADEYEVAHILLRAPESASPEQIQSLKLKAEQVFDRGGGDGGARPQRIDRDLAALLAGQPQHDEAHAEFRHRVGGGMLEPLCLHVERRRQHQDVRVIGLLQMRDAVFRHHEGAAGIDTHHQVEPLHVGSLRIGQADGAGIVDADVDAAELGDRLVDR